MSNGFAVAETESRLYLQCFPYQLSDEDTLKSVACKKMVTFDLSSSEDTNSISSANIHLPKCKFLTGLILCAQCFWQSDFPFCLPVVSKAVPVCTHLSLKQPD